MYSKTRRWIELRSYVGFTDEDSALLASFYSIALPHFHGIADELYALVRRHRGAVSVLQDEAQAQGLHASLQVWLGELLRGPCDDAYVESRDGNGRVHERLGLELPYMIAAMSRVRDSLQRVAADALADDASVCDATRLAIAHACDLALAMTLDGYQDDLVRGAEHAAIPGGLAATGALAAGLAHEIRNPLNGASLHLSILDRTLARSPGVPQVAREATDVLRAEIKRLGTLVTDFLEVARPTPLARVECDVNDLARSVEALFALEAERCKKVLVIEPSPSPAKAKLDVGRIQQVLANLVRNGLDSVVEGGQVVVRVRCLLRHLEIDVADDGPGIADPAAPIFDPFFTTKKRGRGLGLSIVHRIVSDHGGEVRFQSRPGSTVFTVRVPIRDLASFKEAARP